MLVRTEDKKDFVKKGELFDKYQGFCVDNSQKCHRRSELFDRLKEKGFLTSVKDGYDIYRGIKLNLKLMAKHDKGKNIMTCDDDDEYKEAYELSQTQLKAVNDILTNTLDENKKQRKLLEDMKKQEEDNYNEIVLLKKQLEALTKPVVKNEVDHTQTTNEKYFLFVPFEFKEHAKKLGAQWDSERSRWYIHPSSKHFQLLKDTYHGDNFKIDFYGSRMISPPANLFETDSPKVSVIKNKSVVNMMDSDEEDSFIETGTDEEEIKHKTIKTMMDSDSDDSDSDSDDDPDYIDEYESDEDADEEEYNDMAKLLSGI
jgi:hypothetical protein